MKRSLITAAFAVAFAGAVGASAGTTVNLKGSDTLFDLTNAVYAACQGPGGTPGPLPGPYAGSGSGNGQNAMATGAQQVAPMSRYLNASSGANSTCTGVGAAPTASEGLVIALDGLSVVGSKTTFTHVACNGDDNPTCDPTFEPGTGAAYDTTVTPTPVVACTVDTDCPANSGEVCSSNTCVYTFNGWRDVLRVVLAGFVHSGAATGTNAAAVAARDCLTPARLAIANNYGAFFENKCAASAGDTTGGVCTQIRHIFRRDDFSGTTDTVVGLLGLPSIVQPSSTNNIGFAPFCNSIRPASTFPTPAPTCLQGSDATWSPTINPTAANLGTCTKEKAVYRSTMQDNDPIRRTCINAAGTIGEDVCSHSGDLGLVLPMNDVPEPSPRTNADRYNVPPCIRGKLSSVTAPDVFDAISNGKIICTRGLLCPNGDICNNLGGCLAPATNAGNVQCLATKLTAPGTPISSTSVPLAHPVAPGIAEGRAYNQHLYLQVGSAGAYQSNAFATPFPVTGAYYRIHASHSLQPAVSPAVGRTCQFADMTDQIGCLVEASPCSLGYAGLTAVQTNPNVSSVKLNKQTPEQVCIQGNGTTIPGFAYPFSRKLYLNTLKGFNAATAEELQFAGCETNLDQTGFTGTPAGLMTSGSSDVTAFGFLHIGPSVNGGQPFCEDYNETMICGAASFATNNNACGAAHTTLNYPTFNTTCGNGIKEAYEDCDCGFATVTPSTTLPDVTTASANVADCAGTANGGAICSTICRHNQ